MSVSSAGLKMETIFLGGGGVGCLRALQILTVLFTICYWVTSCCNNFCIHRSCLSYVMLCIKKCIMPAVSIMSTDNIISRILQLIRLSGKPSQFCDIPYCVVATKLRMVFCVFLLLLAVLQSWFCRGVGFSPILLCIDSQSYTYN
jgi:hypothetical protein